MAAHRAAGMERAMETDTKPANGESPAYMPSSFRREVLAAGVRHASEFRHAGLPPEPRRRFAVLTCMDARMDPLAILGLEPGDAHVIRNAGGRASDDALRSLIISNRLLRTRAIAVIHHTHCGMATYSNERLRAEIRSDTGEDASAIDFLFFKDLDKSVREDVAAIRASRLIAADVEIMGFVYDVRTGLLREISYPESLRRDADAAEMAGQGT